MADQPNIVLFLWDNFGWAELGCYGGVGPVISGFDEAVWCARTADETFWPERSYFPRGAVTSAPYASEAEIPLAPQVIYSRKKGSKAGVIATFLLGDAEESGRDTVLCLQAGRLHAVKWRQWKMSPFRQNDFYSTWEVDNIPHLHNLEWDPQEPAAQGVSHPAA